MMLILGDDQRKAMAALMRSKGWQEHDHDPMRGQRDFPTFDKVVDPSIRQTEFDKVADLVTGSLKTSGRGT